MSAGTVNDGLGQNDMPAQSGSNIGTVNGIKYIAQPVSGGTFMVSLSINATASTAPGPNYMMNGEMGIGTCLVSAGVGPVSFTVSPAIISLSGTTVSTSDGGQNILVGQHCGASFQTVPSACAVTYQWTVSGTTFQTWSADTPAIGNNPYNPDASYEVDGPGILTNPTAGWYWNDLSDGNGKTYSETVSCTATVTPPAGEGAAFTLTASQPVTVWTPTWVCQGYGGSVQIVGPVSGDYLLQATGIPVATGGSAGMYITALVASPNSVLFGNGSLAMSQLAIPGLSYTDAFGYSYVWSLNDQEGLDTTYPYPWTASSSGSPTQAPNYTTIDSPDLNLTRTSAVLGVLDDEFEDYMMYFAPGSTQCVPVAHFVWSTHGTANMPMGGWIAGTAAGTVSPSGSETNFTQINSFPMWTQNDETANGQFVLY